MQHQQGIGNMDAEVDHMVACDIEPAHGIVEGKGEIPDNSARHGVVANQRSDVIVKISDGQIGGDAVNVVEEEGDVEGVGVGDESGNNNQGFVPVG